MKIFISSLITGMDAFRAAAREAVTSLNLEPLMAEDFSARPQSPQVACLDAVRQADAVVLILGGSYGAKQPSGLSATHEEYREARDRCPVFVFVQERVESDAGQSAFLKEVEAWESGFHRRAFSTPDSLRGTVTRALHEWLLAKASGPLDINDLTTRSREHFPQSHSHRYELAALRLGIDGGPTQQILRPIQIEDRSFAEELQQAALFGPTRIFTPSEGCDFHVQEHRLVLEQKGRRQGSISLGGTGSIVITLPIEQEERAPLVLLEENVQKELTAALRYATWLLDRIDRTERLSHVVVALSIIGGTYLGWRTRREHDANPNSMSMGSSQETRPPVYLAPSHRTRAAIRLEQAGLVEDFVVLLRRQWRQ